MIKNMLKGFAGVYTFLMISSANVFAAEKGILQTIGNKINDNMTMVVLGILVGCVVGGVFSQIKRTKKKEARAKQVDNTAMFKGTGYKKKKKKKKKKKR